MAKILRERKKSKKLSKFDRQWLERDKEETNRWFEKEMEEGRREAEREALEVAKLEETKKIEAEKKKTTSEDETPEKTEKGEAQEEIKAQKVQIKEQIAKVEKRLVKLEKEAEKEAEKELIRKKALAIMENEKPLLYILKAFHKLHPGDDNVAAVLLLSLMCQSIENSSGIQPYITGKSTGGKTHCCLSMLHLVPKVYWEDTTVSDKSLFYRLSQI